MATHNFGSVYILKGQRFKFPNYVVFLSLKVVLMTGKSVHCLPKYSFRVS